MGHVKQKKPSINFSSPPEAMAIEEPKPKRNIPRATMREHHSRSYPEELNAEELISQINCRTMAPHERVNDSNNNNNTNIRRASTQLSQGASTEDIENGPVERHHRQRPLYRRIYTFIRNLINGAKFNVGSDGKLSRLLLSTLFDYNSRRSFFSSSYTSH